MNSWNPDLYAGRHSFVYELGEELVELADVRAGERVLDVGCGTGELTARLAERGAEVVGIDASPAMVEAARDAYPDLPFEVRDVLAIEASEAFDVVFSNAVLHWVQPPDEAARRMAGALRPGARLVAEFGGAGNVRRIRAATDRALQEAGLAADALQHPWFNPTAEEYTAILGEAGLRVTMAELFERPTPLEGQDGLRNWLEMFRRPHFHDLDPETVGAILDRTVEIARPDLYADGTWHADYVRLRVAAVKPQAARGARPSSRSL